MRVYIELFLLDNAIMDGLTLCLAAALCGLRLRPVIGALLCLLGAGYAVLSLAGPTVFRHPAFRLAFAFVMALGLRFRGVKQYLRAALCTLLAAAALGGAMLLVSLLLGGGIENGILLGGLPLRAALWGAAACLPLPRLWRSLRNTTRDEGHKLRLRLLIGGAWREYEALYDTGNSLIEPISGLPVVLLPEDLLKGPFWPAPYCGAGGEGLVLCRRPERAECLINGAWQALDIMAATAPAQTTGGQAIIGSGALPPAWPAENMRRASAGGRGRHEQHRDTGNDTKPSIPAHRYTRQGRLVRPFRGDPPSAPQPGSGAIVDHETGSGG